jgi:D-glycero-D-manno-heptose 1,7-bisphosphate phosphatase
MRKPKLSRPAVFLDRDGTLIHDASYLSDPRQVKFFGKTAQALRLLREDGFRLFVVTNQSGVARGYFPESSVRKVHAKVQSLLKSKGAGIDGFFYCPHYPGGKVKSLGRDCACRKPKTGMVKQAARKFPLDLKKSYMVGDKIDDVLLGKKASLKASVLVRTGYGRQSEKELKGRKLGKTPVVSDILSAAKWILADRKIHKGSVE